LLKALFKVLQEVFHQLRTHSCAELNAVTGKCPMISTLMSDQCSLVFPLLVHSSFRKLVTV
jgi:hypothetical protein